MKIFMTCSKNMYHWIGLFLGLKTPDGHSWIVKPAALLFLISTHKSSGPILAFQHDPDNVRSLDFHHVN